MAFTVLVIEDDPDTSEIVQLYLREEGFRVLTAETGPQGMRLFNQSSPDLIILDLMLPDLDGMEVCRLIRKESLVPIVMLTARVEEKDKLAGLELGADDYIVKPFSPNELTARVKAVMRRTERDILDTGPERFSYGDIILDTRVHEARVRGTLVPLTPTEMRLMVLFMREPRRVFSREQIVDRIIGNDLNKLDRTVDVHISNLRRKLKAHEADYIQTVYGVGYRFSHE